MNFHPTSVFIFPSLSLLTRRTTRRSIVHRCTWEAELGTVKGGGGNCGKASFFCVDSCASCPTLPPKRACPALLSPLFYLPCLPCTCSSPPTSFWHLPCCSMADTDWNYPPPHPHAHPSHFTSALSTENFENQPCLSILPSLASFLP